MPDPMGLRAAASKEKIEIGSAPKRFSDAKSKIYLFPVKRASPNFDNRLRYNHI